MRYKAPISKLSPACTLPPHGQMQSCAWPTPRNLDCIVIFNDVILFRHSFEVQLLFCLRKGNNVPHLYTELMQQARG